MVNLMIHLDMLRKKNKECHRYNENLEKDFDSVQQKIRNATKTIQK